MIVVADATPLHYLIIIEHSDVFPKIFKKVIIPPAVAAELGRPKAPEVVRAWISGPPAWLEIRSPLIVDDHDDRQAAARRKIPVIGTLRVLDEAAGRSAKYLTTGGYD